MSEPPSDEAWTPPRTFDSFEVERALGIGGMGHVYLGRDVMLDRRVALKFIAAASPSAKARARFIAEARAIAKLLHPNVVGVFRIGDVDGRPYIAYEFVDGRSLDRLVRPITWGAGLRIATLLARGLEASHLAGIVHRDVKPSNVMLSTTGEVKLLDFGIAKLGNSTDGGAVIIVPSPTSGIPGMPFAATEPDPVSERGARPGHLTRPGALIGTPAYLAPELWSGQSATTRSDIFAVGLVLFELLRGSLPFATLAGEALARAVVEVDIPPVRAHRPEIPPAFAAIIDKCLRRNALARYESAVELRRELEEIRAIYLTRADALDDVRLESEARLVADSFTRILSRSDALTSGVYERLFEADPDVRALFPADLDAQKDKLLHALRLAIEGLHQPDRIVELLRGLGRRHGAYGVLPSHFESLGLALQSTVRELDGDAWNDELARAWQRAYSFISTAMRQGLCEVGSTLVSDVDAAPPMAQSRSTSAISK